jgi:hypothetical protein
MKSDEWSLNGGSAEIEKDVPPKPEVLTILTPTKSEIERVIDERKIDCFSGFFNTPSNSEVKVLKIETLYQPFLIVISRYVARYLRKNNYEWKVNSDVVTVKIVEDVLNVDNKPIKVSNLLAKGVSGLTVGGGVIGFSCEPLEDVVQKGVSKIIGKHDMALLASKKLCLSLLEHAIYDTKDKTMCYDASTASIVEAPQISKLINGPSQKRDDQRDVRNFLIIRKLLRTLKTN